MSQCRCPYPEHGSTPIGTSLGNGVVGNWQALPDTQLAPDSANAEHELKQCACGCNTYSGTSLTAPLNADELDIPVLPLVVEYEDDDGPSDDHEYVSVKITDLADMQSAIQSCTCQDH
jgi:hypothetical protein